MARPKRKSRILSRAEMRLASIKSINPTLDIGDGLTVVDVKQKGIL